MGTKIYVGNLSFGTTEDGLMGQFSQYGEVLSTKIIIDQMTNRSKGFAFVEMENGSAAASAIEALNGLELDGRSIKVNLAKAPERRSNSRY